MPIEIKNLNKSYNGLQVIKNYHFTFQEGKIYCLYGPSGCGKTTLLHIIAGILPFNSGTITGTEKKRIAVVFQEDRLLPWLTAEENIKFVLGNKHFDAGKYLEVVGLKEFKKYHPHQLSGGMKRRVAIARALAYHGQVLLMDEPFKGIDEEVKRYIMDSILKEKEQIVIFSTHNLQEAAYMAHETIKFTNKIHN